MYPYVRAGWAMYRASKMPPLGLFDIHVSHHRAWPTDTDIFGELNHGRILTLFELGRWQMSVRMGLARTLRTHRIGFAVAGVSVRYRKRIPVMARYRMQTQLLGWDDRFMYVDQSMWMGDEACHQLLLRAATRDRNGTVLPERFLKLADMDNPGSPQLPPWVTGWIVADKTRPWPPKVGPVHT